MFSNPIYNLPPQFNENLLSQNLAGLSLNHGQPHQMQQQRQNLDFGSFQFPQAQQQLPIDLGGYIPSAADNANTNWSAPPDVNGSYQRGSTAVRHYNNSNIDDYYKKFLRPITDYVPVPTNGQPTYVYQNLGGQQQTTAGTTLAQQPTQGGEILNNSTSTVSANSHPITTDQSEEKKHRKKHKKRSSKHGHSEKTSDEKKSSTTDKTAHHQQEQQQLQPQYQQQQPPPQYQQQQQQQPPPQYQQQQQQQQPQYQQKQQQQVAAAAPPTTQAGGVGPQVPMKNESNPVVYFDIEIDGDPRGRLVMELFRHVLPRTAQNFLSLCLNEYGFGFRTSYFHRIIPGFMAQGGDFEKSNGTGGYSIYGEKFDDEAFPFQHDRPGLLSMANSGPNTNGSQFFLTFVPCPHLDNKHVVFGQVLQGFHLLKDLEMSGSDDGDVIREVKIENTGQLQ